jgi:hypothetical protein
MIFNKMQQNRNAFIFTKIYSMMKRLGLFTAIFSLASVTLSQTIKKIPVDKSGCSVYTYCELKFETEYSQDSSIVYVSECVKDEVNYGVICVKLKNTAASLAAAEETLVAYLDYLKTSFSITKTAGYGKGHYLANNENTRGVLDYWEDKDKHNWKVKGWTDGNFISVLYGYSAKDLPEVRLNVFLEGFRFPGM